MTFSRRHNIIIINIIVNNIVIINNRSNVVDLNTRRHVIEVLGNPSTISFLTWTWSAIGKTTCIVFDVHRLVSCYLCCGWNRNVGGWPPVGRIFIISSYLSVVTCFAFRGYGFERSSTTATATAAVVVLCNSSVVRTFCHLIKSI